MALGKNWSPFHSVVRTPKIGLRQRYPKAFHSALGPVAHNVRSLAVTILAYTLALIVTKSAK